MKKLLGLIGLMLACACGGVPDMANDDVYPLIKHTSIDGAGHEIATYERGEFDEELYGQAQEALSVAPPRRYGISSAADPQSNDTRCPAGGFTSGSSFCEVAGGKHINWDLSGVDGRIDSQLKVQFRPNAISGFTSIVIDSSPTGFVQETGNPNRAFNGAMFFNPGDCPMPGGGHAIACTTDVLGPVTLAGGQRVRLLTTGNVLIRLVPESITGPQLSILGMTAAQQGKEIANLVIHELGHSMGFGHVPSTENAVDALSLDNGQSNQVVKHLSATEKSQLTSWLSTF
jgi:hypothetical protein